MPFSHNFASSVENSIHFHHYHCLKSSLRLSIRHYHHSFLGRHFLPEAPGPYVMLLLQNVMLYLIVPLGFPFERVHFFYYEGEGEAAALTLSGWVGLESTMGTSYQNDPDTIAFSTVKLTKITNSV